jgi:hypothetical protein
MARIADEWPGALRELDMLPRGEIERRIVVLTCVERETSSRETPSRETQRAAHAWIHAQCLFHRLARGALLAKKWLAKRKAVGDRERAAFVRAMRGREKRDALAWADALERIATPPRGRVLDLVYARVATELGVSDAAARAMIFSRE